jgi:hypothetical protein
VPDVVLALAGFFAISGWWFVRNKELYGQFLATRASVDYLKPLFFLRPVPWSVRLLFREDPHALFASAWYPVAGWGDALPLWATQALWAFALVTIVGGVWVFVIDRAWISSLNRLAALGVVGCAASGLVAFLIVSRETGPTAGRVTYVGLSAFALIAVAGATRIAGGINPKLENPALVLWPTGLGAASLYAVFGFLVPFSQL